MRHHNLLTAGEGKLTRTERLQIELIRRSFELEGADRALRWCQQRIGSRWISWVTRNLHHIHHTERLDSTRGESSFILVANHRSFFDLYLITAELIRLGMRHRIVFPVRSEFFYDNPLGLVVNGAMSFFAMYPPIFRDPARASLNLVGLDELGELLRRGRTFVGVHPEGRRNKSTDPYSLLPGQSGVGRLIRQAGVPVIPAFTNGLRTEGLLQQIRGNFDGTGETIHTVFGNPIDFGDRLARPPSPRLYREIIEVVMTHLGALGAEERELRQRTLR